jgi:hypothetical protein
MWPRKIKLRSKTIKNKSESSKMSACPHSKDVLEISRFKHMRNKTSLYRIAKEKYKDGEEMDLFKQYPLINCLLPCIIWIQNCHMFGLSWKKTNSIKVLTKEGSERH